jgi:acyl-CoA synthetase (AMP-forming)/AMP-acid ligase II
MVGSAAMSAAPGPSWPWLVTAPTFSELIACRAEQSPDALLLADEHGERVTCGEFRNRVDRVAAALAASGIGPGRRVAWQLPTRISTVLVMAALRRLGALQAPVIPLYRKRETTAALAGCAAEFFLVPGTWRDFDYVAMTDQIARDGGPAPQVMVIGADAPESGEVAALPTPPADPGEVAFVYFTSGSTGTPKGVRHCDESLLLPGAAFAGMGQLGRTPGEVGAMGFPVAHVGGIEYLIAALCGGFPLLLLEAFVPGQAVDLFRRHGVTTTGGAPPFYRALVAMARSRPSDSGERLLPDLRTLKGGGAPCPPELFAEVRDELGAVLAHDYGMTEVPMVAVASPDDPGEILAQTDGRPIPANQVRLAGPDGGPAAPGEVGAIEVTGPGVCRGYTDPAETAAAFTADGWFRTGDLGRLHPSGHLEVVGRIKELIIRKGENIAPQEIEQLLGRHPDVEEAAVLGVPDPGSGERVCAVIVPVPGRPAPGLREIAVWLLAAGLMPQKLPEQLETVDALPRSGLGKVAKAQLRDRFARPAP